MCMQALHDFAGENIAIVLLRRLVDFKAWW